jgi:hypothetical protein
MVEESNESLYSLFQIISYIVTFLGIYNFCYLLYVYYTLSRYIVINRMSKIDNTIKCYFYEIVELV